MESLPSKNHCPVWGQRLVLKEVYSGGNTPLKFTLCTVQCFLKRGSKEFWLASSFEGHGSSLRSLPHPSNYPRTPLIWFEQQVLFFNLRLAMIWHVFLFNFLQLLQNTQEAPCLCHSRPGWYETIRDRKWVSVAVMKILRSVRQNQYGVHLPKNGPKVPISRPVSNEIWTTPCKTSP